MSNLQSLRRLPLLGKDRMDEIEKVERNFSLRLRRMSIEQASGLSYIEVYAAAIRAIEGIARGPTEDIRERAREVSAKCGLETDFGADCYQRQRDALLAREPKP